MPDEREPEPLFCDACGREVVSDVHPDSTLPTGINCYDCGTGICTHCSNTLFFTTSARHFCGECAPLHICHECNVTHRDQMPACNDCGESTCEDCTSRHHDDTICLSCCSCDEEDIDEDGFPIRDPADGIMVSDTPPFRFNGKDVLFPTNVRMGVEFEVEGNGDRDIRQLRTSGWGQHRDGSLDSTGCEFITPPLRGEGVIGKLYNDYNCLLSHGWHTSERCGLHAHFSFTDVSWNTRRLVRLAATWNSWMQTLYLLQRRNRIASGYCAANVVNAKTYLTYRKRVQDGAGRSGVDMRAAQELFGCDRYQGLNVACALSAHGTVEFRLGEATDHAPDAVMWNALLAWIIASLDEDPDAKWASRIHKYESQELGEADIPARVRVALQSLRIPSKSTEDALYEWALGRYINNVDRRGMNSRRLYETTFIPHSTLLRRYLRDSVSTTAEMLWASQLSRLPLGEVEMIAQDTNEGKVPSYLMGYIRAISVLSQNQPSREQTPNSNILTQWECDYILHQPKVLTETTQQYVRECRSGTHLYAHSLVNTVEVLRRAERLSFRNGIPMHNPAGFRLEV